MDKNDAYDEGKISKDEIQQFDVKKVENKAGQNQKRKGLQKKEQTKILKKKSIKRWTTSQKIRYLIFVINYKQTLESRDQSQKNGICVKMSRFIETKEKNVCSEHHFDLLNRYKSIDGVIEYLKKILYFDKEIVQKQVSRMEKFILGERQRQYNAINVLKRQNNVVPDRQIFDFQSINSEINLNVLWKQKEKANNQQKNPNIDENYLDIEIPIEVNLIIKKSELDTQTIKAEEQKRQKKKNDELDKSKNVMREIIDVENSRVIFESNQIKKEKKKFRTAIDEEIHQQAFQSQIQHQISSSEICQSPNMNQIQRQSKEQFSNEEQLESEKICVQEDKVLERKFKGKIWTISEMIKLIIFLSVYKSTFESKDLRLKSGIMTKLSKYIGTGKTKNQCYHRLNFYKRKYNNSYSRIVEEQKKRLHISEELIEKQKIFIEKINLLNNTKRYNLRLAASTIIHRINKKDYQLNPIANIRLSLNSELSCILVQEQIDEQKQNINSKDSYNQLQEENQNQLSKQRKDWKKKEMKGDHNTIKQKYTIQVDPEIFRKLSRSFKDKTYSEKGSQLVDFSKNHLIIKAKVKQPVRIIFVEDQL